MTILHITDKNKWAQARQAGIYQGNTLAQDGFIHCCMESQLAVVLERWFPGGHDLVILEIDPECLDARLVYENLEGGSEQFPHIYGPLNLDAVVGTREERTK